MRFRVKVNIQTDEILRSRGLGSSHDAERYLASEVLRLSDPYTPFQQGTLKAGQVNPGSPTTIEYNTPYAHYQWAGMAMGGRAPKHYTGKSLTYSGGPMRGKEWTKRMMADRGAEVVKSLAVYVGGKPK